MTNMSLMLKSLLKSIESVGWVEGRNPTHQDLNIWMDSILSLVVGFHTFNPTYLLLAGWIKIMHEKQENEG